MKKFLSDNISASVFIGIITLISIFMASPVFAETLSCSVTTAAACVGGTNAIILRMSGSTNAHAELPSGTNYTGNVVCCSGVTGLGNSCSTGVTSSVLWLAGTTNAHSSQAQTNANYNSNACISVPTGGTISVGYQASNCTGYDTTLGSMSGDTNAHVGDGNAYARKICATTAAIVALPLPASATLTSSVYDTTANTTSVGYNSIMWKGTPGTGKVSFQFAASPSFSGPWNYYGGATCGPLAWFDTIGPDNPVELKEGLGCIGAWNNKRYYRYKVQICSASDCAGLGSISPIINKIIVNWAP